MRKKFVLSVMYTVVCLLAFMAGCAPASPLRDYGVFLGISGDRAERLDRYRLLVIEPSEFQEHQIREFHAAGKTVYGYINIGAVEEYRPYYGRFRETTLGVYEDWPDERWVDVTSPAWQDFIVEELGKRYAAMGLDGFFLDNADVYYLYLTDDMFQGLCDILKGLRGYGIPLIINGGDRFVSRCIDENIALSLFDGVNQETVFTRIDFENRTYGRQTKTETAYYREYLSKAKEGGLSVYLLEYAADRVLAKQIDAYCRVNGFLWYNAEDIELR